MKVVAYVWGISGVIFILVFAIYRLTPMALALKDIPLDLLHWLSLVISIVCMAYAEGYKGFHLSFAPRVVIRADYLTKSPKFGHVVLAPLFCMGYIHATRKRQFFSYGLTLMIIGFVIIVRSIPQPWRGILDAGVVVGLTMGCFSIFYFIYIVAKYPDRIFVNPDVPSGEDK